MRSNRDNFVRAINDLQPTTALLDKYNPEYTCLLLGAKTLLDTGYHGMTGGDNGKSLIVDAALLFGKDQYRYPDNLPIIGAKGGPAAKPGCGSLPDVAKNFPSEDLGHQHRVGPQESTSGLTPGSGDRSTPIFPATRGNPESPALRGQDRGPARRARFRIRVPRLRCADVGARTAPRSTPAYLQRRHRHCRREPGRRHRDGALRGPQSG